MAGGAFILGGALRPPSAPRWSESADLREALAIGRRPGERAEEDPQDPVSKAWREIRLCARRATGGAALSWSVRRAAARIDAARSALEAGPEAARTEAALLGRIEALRPRLRREGLGGPAAIKAFALVAALSHRVLGLAPYRVQLEGAWALSVGLLAEMRTGEGKTLTAVQTAAVAALAGAPTHVVTVNPYLTERDAAFARPLLERLGLTVAVVSGVLEFDARKAAYAADVVYAVNKQLAFDYLRDRIAARAGSDSVFSLSAARLAGGAGPDRALRGLHFAIVDEADSVLIDEARTALIISRKRPNPDVTALAEAALTLARGLEVGLDYKIDPRARTVELTAAGRAKARAAEVAHALLLRGRRRRETAAQLGLYALHLLERDEHYAVADGKVSLIDEYTGRFMPDRSWGQGLQQMVELKEGVEPTDPTETTGQITYQRFFRRYRSFSGMTGTAYEAQGEMWRTFRLATVRIRPRKRSRLVVAPTRVAATAAEKWALVAARAGALSAAGRAVLIGARTVAAAEAASAALEAAGLTHQLLSAAHDDDEAAIVAAAGGSENGRGRITVATNMAGRGTDIGLSEAVRQAGGLAVILSERHDSRRVDRQLIGRAGRQGDPGGAEAILSLEDALLVSGRLDWAARRLAPWLSRAPLLARPAALLLFRLAQRRLERTHARMRARAVAQDRKRSRLLAFAGPPE